MTVFKAYPRPLWPSRGRRPTRPVRINIINFVILFCSIISHTECLLQRTNLIPDEGNRLNEDYPESHNSIADIHHHDGYQEQEGEDDDEGGLFEDVHQGQHRHEGRCIEQTAHEPKNFYYGENALALNILTSDRLSHKLVSNILQIFAEEVLGYCNVSIVKMSDPTHAFDPNTQFSYISSCSDESCQNLDEMAQMHLPSPVPKAMVNLETWLPNNYQVEDWQVEDLGRLGPGGRFGWFIPERFAEQTPPIKDHWRAFTTTETAQMFAPSKTDLEFIFKQLKQPNGSYWCREDWCEGQGMYISDHCHKLRHEEESNEEAAKCALMITDFPINSSIYSSTAIVDQIKALGLKVNIAFVGNNLLKTIEYLENQSATIRSGKKSYLLFHYAPSVITTLYNMTSIKFEPCDQARWTHNNLFNSNQSLAAQECLYIFNRFAKVIWPPVKEGAQSFYSTVKKIEFSPDHYRELFILYQEAKAEFGEKNERKLLRAAACKWLNSEQSDSNGEFLKPKKNYERWSHEGRTKQKLKIGGIFPKSGNKYVAPELMPVAQLAKSDVNMNGSILSNYELHLNALDGQCTADVVMKRFIEIITNWDYKSVVGILGPACSDTVEPIAGVSKHFRTVVITYSAEGSISTDDGKESYPYFFRTIAENRQYKNAYLDVLKRLDWHKVASLTQDGHKYSEYISHLQDLLQTNGITFIMNRKFQSTSSDMTLYLDDLKKRGARILIGEFYESAARHILCEAYKQGMTQKQGYVWFLPNWFSHDWYDIDALLSIENSKQNTPTSMSDMPNCTTAQMIEAVKGHLSLAHANYAKDDAIMQTGKTVREWREDLKSTLDKQNFNGKHPNKYSGYVYDAVWLYALALDRLIKQNKSYIQDIHSERSVNEFVNIIKNVDFQGVTGRINFHNGNSRLSNIKIMQWYDNDTHEIGVYEPNYTPEPTYGRGRLIEWNANLLRWFTPNGEKPVDHSKDCSILSSFATALNIECEHAITVAFVICFGSLFCLLLLTFIVVKRRYEQKMKQTEERMRALGLLTPSCVLTLDEWEIPRDRVVINRKLGEGAFGTVYGGEAFFDEKGWVAVAVKTLKTGSSLEEKLDFLGEADMMKRFDHRNIVKLLGVCTRNEPVYTVMEFMLYGDLKTYLLARRHLVNERDREEMDEVSNRRLTSMALDVARGLSYLKELKYVHRDIACRNCLVNSTRVVKLADFGMTRPMYENDYYRFSRKGMLPVRWMAPESLADGLFTPMSDVWSYGVLLYEMITFGSFPFQGLSNNQVLEHVKAGNMLNIPSGIKPQLETLLKSCWCMTPTKRPTASEIVELLSNNTRLISPCIDVPLASVQVERTDSLELIPSVRKPSGSVSQTNRPVLSFKRSMASRDQQPKDYSFRDHTAGDTNGGHCSPYSPMSGHPNGLVNGSPPNHANMNNHHHPLRFDVREPLLTSRETPPTTRSSLRQPSILNNNNSSSYVPPGYILLDHTNSSGHRPVHDLHDYVSTSISSV